MKLLRRRLAAEVLDDLDETRKAIQGIETLRDEEIWSLFAVTDETRKAIQGIETLYLLFQHIFPFFDETRKAIQGIETLAHAGMHGGAAGRTTKHERPFKALKLLQAL